MSWTRSGKISVTNGQVVVTGTGTNWITTAGAGEALQGPDGRYYEIANIASNTEMTLGSPYLGATQAAQDYAIMPSQSYIRDLAAQAAVLVNEFSDVVANLGTLAAQDANAVDVNGGAIDGVVIGGRVPGAVHATTLSAGVNLVSKRTVRGICTYGDGTIVAHGFKIKTRLPAGGDDFVTLRIHGYDYRAAIPIDLTISLYNYTTVIQCSAASGSAWLPNISAAFESGYLVVHMGKQMSDGYYVHFDVDATFYNVSSASPRIVGWTVVDEALVGTGVVNIVAVNRVHFLQVAPGGFINSSGAPLDLRADGATVAQVSPGVLAVTGVVTPESDNARTLGTGALRWATVYAGSGTINTSDAREKTDIAPLKSSEIEAAKQLAKEIGTYKFLEAIKDKGSSARSHVGMTVQRAIEVMTSHGLNPFGYGFICHDEWGDLFVEHAAIDASDAQDEVIDSDGNVLKPYVSAVEAKDAWTEQTQTAGDRYAFRYEQLNLFIAAGIEARIAALEAKLC